MLLQEFVMLIETVILVNISHLKATFAREFVQLDIHIKIPFVFQIAYQDLEITDLVVVYLKVLLLDAHSHTSINKVHVSQHAVQDHIQTLRPEFAKLVVQTVTHAYHLLFVLAAAQVLI
jgi:hypothetical protein